MDIFNLNNKKIFVIGGSGLIGSEICSLLKLLGAKVYNLDILNNLKSKENVQYLLKCHLTYLVFVRMYNRLLKRL